jgi:transposase
MLKEKEKHDLILAAFCAGHSAPAIVTMLKSTVSRATVFKVIKEFKTTGKTMKKPHDCKKPVCTPEMKKRIKSKLRRNPNRSIRQLAKEESVSKTTMWHLIRKDLGMFP